MPYTSRAAIDVSRLGIQWTFLWSVECVCRLYVHAWCQNDRFLRFEYRSLTLFLAEEVGDLAVVLDHARVVVFGGSLSMLYKTVDMGRSRLPAGQERLDTGQTPEINAICLESQIW